MHMLYQCASEVRLLLCRSMKSVCSAPGLCRFIGTLRELSGGKPVGFKLCIGQPEEFSDLVHAMLDTGILPDFITVDGGEGGTGAAPSEFINSVGMPMLQVAIPFALLYSMSSF